MPAGKQQTEKAKAPRNEVTSIVANAMRRFVTFSEAEVRALNALESRHEKVRKGAELVVPGEKQSKPFIIVVGSVIEYRVNMQGQRLALDLMLRGDIANLRSTVLSTTDIYMVAGTDAVVSRFTATEFHQLIADHPHLGAVFIWRAAAGRSMLAEHLIDVGRRTAYQRLGHRLLELLVRMELAGLADGNTLTVPFDLVTLADMLGLTFEHTSRTIARLRKENLIEWNDRYVTILDRKRLAKVSDFDPSYLHPGGFPQEFSNRKE